MVYKLTAPQSRSKWSLFFWILFRYSVWIFLVLGVLGELLFEESRLLMLSVSFGVSLVSGVWIYYLYTRNWRRREMLGDLFVTLTDGGVLQESPTLGVRSYTAWQKVRTVQLRGSLLVVQMVTEMVWFFPLDSLSQAKREEMCRFCQERAGKAVPESQQVRPPAEYIVAAPLPTGNSLEQRKEAADYLVRQHQGRTSWLRLLVMSAEMLAILMMGAHYQVTEDWIDLVPAVILLGCFFTSLENYLHPGKRMKKWIESTEVATVHVSATHVLLVSPGAAWALAPKSKVTRAEETRYSHVYLFERGGLFALDKETPPPDSLPLPQRACRWPRYVMLLFVAVLLPLAVSFLIPRKAETEPEEKYSAELMHFIEDMTPVHGYPGRLEWCLAWEEEGLCSFLIEWEGLNDFQLYWEQKMTSEESD